ncbi:hypothetical protein BDW69DRAFT_105256 [Aspergillus filifer]
MRAHDAFLERPLLAWAFEAYAEPKRIEELYTKTGKAHPGTGLFATNTWLCQADIRISLLALGHIMKSSGQGREPMWLKQKVMCAQTIQAYCAISVANLLQGTFVAFAMERIVIHPADYGRGHCSSLFLWRLALACIDRTDVGWLATRMFLFGLRMHNEDDEESQKDIVLPVLGTL